jgi:hypothetical protein
LGWEGGIQGFFFSCSQCVPKSLPKFPICSQQHLDFIPHKVAFPCTQTEKLGSAFDSIPRLGSQRDVSIGECAMFQKIGDGSINLVPSKNILPFVSVCHYLLQFLEPLIRMVYHGIDKDSRQLVERVHTFRPPPLASLVRHLGHLTINANCTHPPFQLQSSPDSSSHTAFLAYQTPSSYTSIAGSIDFCLPGVKNIH